MPLYLAYQTEPEQWTRERLARIIDEYFDIEGKVYDAEEWIHRAEANFEEYERTLRESSHKEAREKLERIGESLLEKAVLFSVGTIVKNHPLLRICFAVRYVNYVTCPDDFTGINVYCIDGGSADLINFKPEMDSFLKMIGIEYEDRSKTELKE